MEISIGGIIVFGFIFLALAVTLIVLAVWYDKLKIESSRREYESELYVRSLNVKLAKLNKELSELKSQPWSDIPRNKQGRFKSNKPQASELPVGSDLRGKTIINKQKNDKK